MIRLRRRLQKERGYSLILLYFIFWAGSCSFSPRSVSDTDWIPPQPIDRSVGVVTGRVTTPSGQAIVQALVDADTQTPGVTMPTILMMTNDQGIYAWTLQPGQYTVTVRTPEYREQTKLVTIQAGQQIDLDFVLDKE